MCRITATSFRQEAREVAQRQASNQKELTGVWEEGVDRGQIDSAEWIKYRARRELAGPYAGAEVADETCALQEPLEIQAQL